MNEIKAKCSGIWLDERKIEKPDSFFRINGEFLCRFNKSSGGLIALDVCDNNKEILISIAFEEEELIKLIQSAEISLCDKC